MTFFQRAIRNFVKGVFFVLIIWSFFFLIIASKHKDIEAWGSGWEQYGIILATLVWGGIVGLGCTEPASKNYPLSILLFAFAIIASAGIAFLICYTMVDPNGKIIEGVIGIGIPLVGLTGAICGSFQFSKSGDK
jgi:CHASE2 domain-containing sensor protein